MEITTCLMSIILFTWFVSVKLKWNKGHDCDCYKCVSVEWVNADRSFCQERWALLL